MLASLTHLRRRVGAFIGGFEAELANRRLRGFLLDGTASPRSNVYKKATMIALGRMEYQNLLRHVSDT